MQQKRSPANGSLCKLNITLQPLQENLSSYTVYILVQCLKAINATGVALLLRINDHIIRIVIEVSKQIQISALYIAVIILSCIFSSDTLSKENCTVAKYHIEHILVILLYLFIFTSICRYCIRY